MCKKGMIADVSRGETYMPEQFGERERNELKQIAEDLEYNKICPDIGERIARCRSRIEAERMMMRCRHAM